MEEINIFFHLAFSFEDFLAKSGYKKKSVKIINEETRDIFTTIEYENLVLKKTLVVDFFPSTRTAVNNRIDLYFSNERNQTISIGNFLAFKKFKRKLNYNDTKEFFFTVDKDDLTNSISRQLERVESILTDEMKEIFTTDAWLNIPTKDPRDDY